MSDDYTPTLHEATLVQLIDELGRRSNGVLVCIVQDTPGRESDLREQCCTYFRGGSLTAVGLAEHARRSIRATCLPAVHADDDDGDDDR